MQVRHDDLGEEEVECDLCEKSVEDRVCTRLVERLARAPE